MAALALVGCGGEDPSGSITELSYSPAHRGNVQVDDYTVVCMPAGSSVSCYPVYVGSHLEERAFPAQWNAVLTRCTPDFKCTDKSIAITRKQFETWAIGDYYPAILKYHGIRSEAR